jgi:hypothetical protein
MLLISQSTRVLANHKPGEMHKNWSRSCGGHRYTRSRRFREVATRFRCGTDFRNAVVLLLAWGPVRIRIP